MRERCTLQSFVERIGIAAGGVITLAMAMHAHGIGNPEPQEEHEEYAERIGDPYLPPPAGQQAQPQPFFERSFPPNVQANVDANQMNLTGDAANEPSLAVDAIARNRIVIGWRQFDNIASNFRQAGFARSIDGGRTWQKATIDPGLFRSDPVLRGNAAGRIFYSSLQVTESPGGGQLIQADMFRSDTGGAVWSGAVPAFGGDKQWIAVDRSGGPGNGYVHQWWQTAGNPFFPNQYTRSLDGGLTFQQPSTIARPIIFGTNDVAGNGDLYIAGQQSSGVWVIRSTNADLPSGPPTFTTLNNNTSVMAGPGGTGRAPNPGGLIGQHQVVVDRSGGPRTGWIYALSTVVVTGSGTDVAFRRSRDGGTTWDPIVFFNGGVVNANSWQWFGTLGLSPSGRLDVVYNDTSTTLQAGQSVTRYLTSSDGGTTWSAPVALGPTWNSLIGWPNQNKIGDYYDIESDDLGMHLAYSTTYNGEQDVWYLRVGPRDCDGNGISDDAEVAAGAAQDCDTDGIPDACEIAAGAEPDANANGVPDRCDRTCDSLDFNNDGIAQDPTDIEAFLSRYSGGLCIPAQATCNDIDFNNDAIEQDPTDIEAFLSVYSGGPCV